MRAALGLLAVCAAALGACSSSATDSPVVQDSTQTRTVTRTATAQPTYLPPPARTVTPQPPGSRLPRGEVERACPYIASTPQENAQHNVADIEGDHVYRTTVLTDLAPVGCRFYFYAGPYEAIADIVPRTFDSALAAHNAMVLTAQRTGSQASGRSDIVPGVDAVLFRTKFFGPDGARDWACAFAKGKVMVVVHTQRTDQSVSALELAKAIASKF
ncbi:hypothetical protein M6B22_12005 [Jatrophihabitans cynanchi]|uniref:DUF3558 domain-containing protein n=1 Tax=Jatrophihabitans cynanchi TaxID=2944128 RepID=A0ABY7JU99_9ACTN|nr:hypothetical protein [Jatrophihabitans sp. SB3-54]WAX55273.1 hypothetical protein M6B22_12005 [Jatrophihabitans sp. SB3-54]